jgi:hypothetical protein
MVHMVFSNLKTWLKGTHHGVSPQHLQAYLNEFTFRFNRRHYPFNSFRSPARARWRQRGSHLCQPVFGRVAAPYIWWSWVKTG